MIAVVLFASLIVAHLFTDYPGQGDFVARAKNPLTPIPGVPWPLILWSHAMMHGGAAGTMVALFSWAVGLSLEQSLNVGFVFGALETVAHGWTDYAKCVGWLGAGDRAFVRDQAIHAACKFAWAGLWLLFVIPDPV